MSAPEQAHRLNLLLRYDRFRCRCPVNDGEDYAYIEIAYKPNDRLVELSSLRAYLDSYRDEAISHEAVVLQITNDLSSFLRPRSIQVRAVFEPLEGVTMIANTQQGH